MKAIELNRKAISLDDSCAPAHSYLGMVHAMIGEYEKSMVEIITTYAADSYALGFTGQCRVIHTYAGGVGWKQYGSVGTCVHAP